MELLNICYFFSTQNGVLSQALKDFYRISKEFFPFAVTSLEILTQYRASPRKKNKHSSTQESKTSVCPPSTHILLSMLRRRRHDSSSVLCPGLQVCRWLETLQDCSKFTGTNVRGSDLKQGSKIPEMKKDISSALKITIIITRNFLLHNLVEWGI